MIADYPFYTDVFLGTLLSEEQFPKAALEADSWLEYFTLGRSDDPGLSEEKKTLVRHCECALAELCFRASSAGTRDPAVTRETVGDYSVSYASAQSASEYFRTRASQIIHRYLSRTGLLSRTIFCLPYSCF